MLSDLDLKNAGDLNANEWRNDGLKSTSMEMVCLPKGEGKHRYVLMVGAKLIEITGNFTLRLSNAPVS